jgi:hypothetical protein
MVRQAIGFGIGSFRFLGIEADQVLAFQQAFVLVNQKDADPDEAEDQGGLINYTGQDLIQGNGTGQQTADLVDRRQEPFFGF